MECDGRKIFQIFQLGNHRRRGDQRPEKGAIKISPFHVSKKVEERD